MYERDLNEPSSEVVLTAGKIGKHSMGLDSEFLLESTLHLKTFLKAIFGLSPSSL